MSGASRNHVSLTPQDPYLSEVEWMAGSRVYKQCNSPHRQTEIIEWTQHFNFKFTFGWLTMILIQTAFPRINDPLLFFYHAFGLLLSSKRFIRGGSIKFLFLPQYWRKQNERIDPLKYTTTTANNGVCIGEQFEFFFQLSETYLLQCHHARPIMSAVNRLCFQQKTNILNSLYNSQRQSNAGDLRIKEYAFGQMRFNSFVPISDSACSYLRRYAHAMRYRILNIRM